MTKSFFIMICIFCSTYIYAQHKLTVEVTHLENNNGLLSMELLDANEKTVKGKTAAIVNNKCTITCSNLKAGSYAIRYFHDENSNKELDTNLIGIPKEGIGFSNDAYGKFGPEDFEEWLFTVNKDTQITLFTTYY